MSFNPDNIQKNVCLKDFVTFKIGGPAELFYEAKTEEEFVAAIRYAISENIPWFVLGGGSNLVISDNGIKGIVIRNLSRDTQEIDHDKCLVKFSSGFSLMKLVTFAQENALSGIEYLAGIPGSLGGAIYGNAGAYGRCIADLLVEAEVIQPDGQVQKVGVDFFKFDYRTSILKETPGIVLNATFQLGKGDSKQIRATMDDIIAQRKSKHPPTGVGCAGSFFKNLPPLPGEDRRRAAGAVLEQAGAKMMSVGGAAVFKNHANFIINNGNATSNDVKELAAMLKTKVKHDFGIDLNEEVLYIGQ